MVILMDGKQRVMRTCQGNQASVEHILEQVWCKQMSWLLISLFRALLNVLPYNWIAMIIGQSRKMQSSFAKKKSVHLEKYTCSILSAPFSRFTKGAIFEEYWKYLLNIEHARIYIYCICIINVHSRDWITDWVSE